MSWQNYVDSNLVGSGNLSSAAIIGLDGAVWAKHSGLDIKAGEAAALPKLFANPGNAQAAGITFGGLKYLTLRADERSIYGKKGAGGIVLVKTGKAILVGIYGEGLQPGNATNVVEKLADYLIENGY